MLIRICVETTQPLAGSAATSGGEPLRFEGWLELLTVVSQLVAAGSGGEAEATDRPVHGDEPDS